MLGEDLESILTRLHGCHGRMSEWQFSGAFEGARMVLALVRAHYPGVKLEELVTTNPPSWEPAMFFEEFKEDAKYVDGACDLLNVIEGGN